MTPIVTARRAYPARRRAAVLALLVVPLVGACMRGRLPPRELYRLVLADSARVETPLAAPSTVVPASGSIAIAPYQTAGVYGERGIVYRIGESEYGVYPSREWALPVSTMLGLVTEDVLRRHPVTRSAAIYDPPSYRTHDYVWRGVVRELEEVNRGRSVFASVRLDVRLVRASDDSVVWSGTARAERPVPQGTMPAIVQALSELSAEVVGRLAQDARAALARSAASAGRN